MTIEDIKSYCLRKNGTTLEFPFDETTMVYKVGGKIFAVSDLIAYPAFVVVKLEPEYIIELKEQYDGATKPSHFNPKYWLCFNLKTDVPNDVIKQAIDSSYNIVYNSLTKAVKKEIEAN